MAHTRKTAFFFYRALLHHWNGRLIRDIIFFITRQLFPKRNNEVLQFIFDFWMAQAVVDAGGHEAELVTDVIADTFKPFREDALRLVESVDGISQLDLTAITAIFDECVRS